MLTATPMPHLAAHHPTGQSWYGALHLQHAVQQGRTVPIKREHVGPLRVQKSLYPDSPRHCQQILLHPPGGVAGGDELHFNLTLEAGAQVLYTTPGAGKWYAHADKTAQQTLQLTIAEQAVAEYLPLENIIFSGARVDWRTRYDVAPGGRLLATEVVCLGRPAAGEVFATGTWQSQTDIVVGNHWAFTESTHLQGDHPLLHSPAGWRGYSVSGNLFVVGAPAQQSLLEACRAVADQLPPELGLLAITNLPDVMLCRILSHSAEDAWTMLRALWQCARPHVYAGLTESALTLTWPRIWRT